MPLEYLFRSHRKHRRSGSSRAERSVEVSSEYSTISLDVVCAQGQNQDQGNNEIGLTALNPNCARWRSSSCLATRTDKSVKGNNSVASTPKQDASPTCPLTRQPDPTGSSTLEGSVGDKAKRLHASVRKKLSNYEHLSRLEFAADGYRLTGQQRELVKLHWQQANSRQGDIGTYVFNWIFQRYPEFKMIFGVESSDGGMKSPLFLKHIDSFTSLLELVVSSVVSEAAAGPGGSSAGISLDDTTGPLLHSYGAKHAQIENDRGEDQLIKPEYWDIFKTAMCEYGSCAWRPNVLSAFSSSAHKRNEALHAWRILVYYVVAKVKGGYETEKNEGKLRGRGRSVAE